MLAAPSELISNPQHLPIADIRINGGTQSRAELIQDAIAEYAEDMKAGAKFPPLLVFYDGKDYWLADGFHRIHAAKKAAMTEIAVEIRQGNRRDAVLFSVGANAHHGLRRTNADKRRAVLTLLSDPEWCQWSNRELAKQCGVRDWLIRKLKEELSARNTQIDEAYAQKCGVREDILREVQQRLESLPQECTAQRRGNTYSISTANIGKNGKVDTNTNTSIPLDKNPEAQPLETVSLVSPTALPPEHRLDTTIDVSAALINDSSPNTDQTKEELTGDEAFSEQIFPEVSVQPEETGKTEFSVDSTENSDSEAQPEEELLGKEAEPEVPSLAVTHSFDEENAEVRQTPDNEHALDRLSVPEIVVGAETNVAPATEIDEEQSEESLGGVSDDLTDAAGIGDSFSINNINDICHALCQRIHFLTDDQINMVLQAVTSCTPFEQVVEWLTDNQMEEAWQALAPRVASDQIVKHLSNDQIEEVWQVIAPCVSSKSLSFVDWPRSLLEIFIGKAQLELEQRDLTRLGTSIENSER